MPGIFFLESMFAPAGQGAEKGNSPGTRQYRNCQFMTPETRSTTHFFWNYLHNFDLDDPNIALSLLQQPGRRLHGGQGDHRGAAEAVRRRSRDHQLLAIAADAALTYFRWARSGGSTRSAAPHARREHIRAIRSDQQRQSRCDLSAYSSGDFWTPSGSLLCAPIVRQRDRRRRVRGPA